MKRVEILYGGTPYSLHDTTAADVRASIEQALDGSASRWLTVNQGEGQPRGALEERMDHLGQQAPSDAVGPLAGRRDGDVAGLILVAELGGPDPGGDRPPAAGQDGTEEEEGEPALHVRSRSARPKSRPMQATQRNVATARVEP